MYSWPFCQCFLLPVLPQYFFFFSSEAAFKFLLYFLLKGQQNQMIVSSYEHCLYLFMVTVGSILSLPLQWHQFASSLHTLSVINNFALPQHLWKIREGSLAVGHLLNHLHHFREQSTLNLLDCIWMRFKFWSCHLLPGNIKFSMRFTLNLLCFVFCQILAFSSLFWTFSALPRPFCFIAVAFFFSCHPVPCLWLRHLHTGLATTDQILGTTGVDLCLYHTNN